MRTRLLAPPAALAVALLAFAGPSATVPVAARQAPPAVDCPAGQVPGSDVAVRSFARGSTVACVPALRPESPREVMSAAAQLAARTNGGYLARPEAYGAAVGQAQVIEAASSPAATWLPVGSTPLNSDVPGYGSTNALGLHQLSGRIEDLAYDPGTSDHWYAAVANGGVYATSDAGRSWHSVGDGLPTQITGAVDYLVNGRTRTLVVGTGDPAFGGSSFSGLGVYTSTDEGRTWHHATGVPSGGLTFSLAHDPAHPRTVYAATSLGLYRSTDAGSSFRNVGLPTTCTDVRKPVCFFANIVTDVVVRPSDRDGRHGGAVLAVVGWRAGQKLNAVGKPQSPRNGLYTSANGAPGSFRYESNAPGFAADTYVGRTSLGVARGPRQNHDYVYAVVQDAQKFNKGATALDLPDASGTGRTNNTVLNGVYASKDFGRTWTELADAQQLQLPGSGTALTGANQATYAPGIQSWYNSWVAPDPTTQDEAGVPARLAFGLEEIWTGAGAIPAAPDTGQYHVVGRYFSGASCGGLNLGGLTGSTTGYCPFSATPTKMQGATTHPDQHAGLWVPDRKSGGVTLVAGNDGGAYRQTLAPGAQLDNDSWGNGIQNGFHDLLPYDAAMSGDGTVVAGLQDNGSETISPDGKQTMAYGGDGFYVAVDPENSNVWYEEYVAGGIRVTLNGGKSWSTINPGLTSALFSTPFVMDPSDSKHLIIGGREIAETVYGKNTSGPTNFEQPNINQPDPLASSTWQKVFDLGTRQHPGSPTAGFLPGQLGVADPTSGETPNSMSAVDTRGAAVYVGYCGFCDIVTGGVPFHSGIATNVGGVLSPKKMTSNGWHFAAAKGLPQRYINSVRIDPANDRTVYVTLGGYGRKWIPPGSLGDDVSRIGKGHVFKSTDAGATFTDISGNLPDIGAEDAFPFQGGLVVATDLGVFVARGTSGGRYALLGKGLPHAPVFRLNRSPRNPRELVAASYGRGVYRIVLGPGGAAAAAAASRGGTAGPAAGAALAPGAGTTDAPGVPAAPDGARSVLASPAAHTSPWRSAWLSGGFLFVLLGGAVALRRRLRPR